MSYEKRLQELGLIIPEAPKPLAAYVPAVKTGNYIYTAGQIPFVQGAVKYAGKVGKDLTEEEAYEAARICAINCLSAIKSITGSLDKVERIVKVTGFVNSAEGFTMQPKVVNGASDLLAAVFGAKGEHARSAVGVSELPLNAAVEVEVIAEVK